MWLIYLVFFHPQLRHAIKHYQLLSNYFFQLNLIDKGGLIIIDNVLWHGDVVDKRKKDKLTTNIREFNSYVNNDKRTENLIIPVGDGLSVCRKL